MAASTPEDTDKVSDDAHGFGAERDYNLPR